MFQIVRLKCTKFDFGWGSAVNPAGFTALQTPSWIGGFTFKERKGRGGRLPLQ